MRTGTIVSKRGLGRGLVPLIRTVMSAAQICAGSLGAHCLTALSASERHSVSRRVADQLPGTEAPIMKKITLTLNTNALLGGHSTTAGSDTFTTAVGTGGNLDVAISAAAWPHD